MFKRKATETVNVEITIRRDVLESVYEECDKYDVDETGGRLVGYYENQGSHLKIEVCGIIGPGPGARRSATSFFQDGKYQESIFRKIESEDPNIEHLGNWHTHHVNGLQTLSSGDIETYRRIVNHEKQNTDFFYALLVVAKNSSSRNKDRYMVKHFLFKRGDPSPYEVPAYQVRFVKIPPVIVDKGKASEDSSALDVLVHNQSAINEIRSRDRDVMLDSYPNLKPFFSKGTKSIYWKGKLPLIDDTFVEVLLLESMGEAKPSYSVTITGQGGERFECQQSYSKRSFDAAWKALFSFERDLNREIFGTLKNSRL